MARGPHVRPSTKRLQRRDRGGSPYTNLKLSKNAVDRRYGRKNEIQKCHFFTEKLRQKRIEKGAHTRDTKIFLMGI